MTRHLDSVKLDYVNYGWLLTTDRVDSWYDQTLGHYQTCSVWCHAGRYLQLVCFDLKKHPSTESTLITFDLINFISNVTWSSCLITQDPSKLCHNYRSPFYRSTSMVDILIFSIWTNKSEQDWSEMAWVGSGCIFNCLI